MQEKLALNVKVPRLGRNRLGVFFVRSSHTQSDGKYKVTQLSLQTKDPSLAKVLGLKFCIHLAGGGTMAGFREFLSTYRVDLKNGQVEADGEEDHRRAVEAQKLMLQSQDKQLEAQRLELQLAEMRQRESDRTIDKFIAKIDPDWRAKYQPLPSRDGALVNSATSTETDKPSSVEPSRGQLSNAMTATPQAPDARQVSGVSDYISLEKRIAQHLSEEKSRGKVPQTIQEKKAVFEDFMALFGKEIDPKDITVEEVTARWRPAEFSRANQKHTGERLSLARLEKRRGYLHKFFEYLIHCENGNNRWSNPMSSKMATKAEIRSKTMSYKEFTSEDLKALFGHNFHADMSKPDWYWMPLMALFSGARLGEIGNLQVQTFEIRDGVKVFEILDGKTSSSKRTIPIHSQLLELGLWDYAMALKARGVTHLFAHRPVATLEKSVGEMWGKWVRRCGIVDDSKVFHSFRSTVC